ncbi:MAG: beta-lactamase family protein [Myxococcales bacterium]|nr:beta-lactamase family protein [Myxococcales bacterium]MBK7195183.1 beta-lactamase family protein [Myxococcales bacterium]MBP6844520.1 beta-lactamase family protein [Kofleriaceae bacterium]
MPALLRRGLETLIRPYPALEVTSIGPEGDPAAAGVSTADVDAIWGAAVAAYDSGLYPALALCLRRRGKIILDRAIGHARGNGPADAADVRKVRARHDGLYCMFSASKMVTAMLVHLLDERHQVHLDDPVAHYIPEFGKKGKHRITLRHVLTHRAGIPRIPSEFADPNLLGRPAEILGLLCEQAPVWRPGRRLGYHALTGGYVLGAVIERVTGKDVQTFLQEEISRPLGLGHFGFGVAPARLRDVAENAFTGPPVVPPLAGFIKRALSVGFSDAVRISNDPRFLHAVIPAGNICTSAGDAARFMQLLLDGGTLDGVRVFEPRTIARAIAEQSYLELDLTLGAPIRYGAGFLLGSHVTSPFGLGTPKAFGHLGFTNVFVWADPERDLAAALMTTGKPALSPGLASLWWLLSTIARRVPRDGRRHIGA